jgi:hypothetical protein
MKIKAQPSNPSMKTQTAIHPMKTMMELLIQLQQLRRCNEQNTQNKQLTEGERHPLRVHKRLVRECLPDEVVLHYDRLRKLEPELLECPEVFAMAVLTTTWRNLTPARRRELETHFTKPARGARPSLRPKWTPKIACKITPASRDCAVRNRA